MKLLILGDMHLSDSKPKRRVDGYKKHQEEKIRAIVDIVERYSPTITIQPGDLCDKWEAPDKFKTRWMRILCQLPGMYLVPGQHDLRYHSSGTDNTPFGVIAEALGYKILSSKPYDVGGGIYLYGAGWNRPVPKIVTPDGFNILVIHKMIVMDKLWDQQEDYQVAGSFLRRYNFNLIVSGDNHQTFYYGSKGKWLINAGTLMRNKIDQESHIPSVFIFDTDTATFKQHMLSVRPFGEVFNLEVAEREEKKNKRLQELSDSLKKKSRIKGLDYKQRVIKRVNTLKANNEIKPLTEKIIGEVMGN